MKTVIDEQVLVLNRGWQVINQTTVEEALKQMCTDVATALDCTDDGNFIPTKWEAWVTLPIRERDKVVHTTKLAIRAPTVIVAVNYAIVPKSRPNLEPKNVAKRDNFICQYTGEHAPDGNVDHVIPRGKGGKNSWENVVWCKKDINSKKGDRLNEEVGLKLIHKPREPLPAPIEVKVRVRPDKPEWEVFLTKDK
jgi:5-methylcytosine-specific restriction endonuclease McrA